MKKWIAILVSVILLIAASCTFSGCDEVVDNEVAVGDVTPI